MAEITKYRGRVVMVKITIKQAKALIKANKDVYRIYDDGSESLVEYEGGLLKLDKDKQYGAEFELQTIYEKSCVLQEEDE